MEAPGLLGDHDDSEDEHSSVLDKLEELKGLFYRSTFTITWMHLHFAEYRYFQKASEACRDF